MQVGVVGAGRMGRPMARRLLRAGHGVRALARTAAARDDLASEGCPVGGDLAEVAAEAGTVLVVVHTDEQVREVCLDGALPDAMPAGSVLVLHTTGSPRTAEAVAARAAERGVRVVDCPVSGGPHDIAAGRLTVFAGGADEDLEKVRPVLVTYAEPVVHVGPLGNGQRVKLINNALFAAHLGLLRDAVALAGGWQVPESVLLTALPHGSAASRALHGVAARGSVAQFAAAVGGFLGKDVDNVRALAADLGGDLGCIEDAVGHALVTPADAT